MSDTRELAERLKKITHFSEIPLSGVEQIIASGEIRQYVKGAFVFHEGDESAGMFVLLNGQVNLSKLGPEGKEGILNTLEPVIMFNEVSALDGGPNPVSAYAHTDIRLWRIGYLPFQQLLRQYPQIGISLLGVLARRNRLLLTHYDDLSFRTVQARMAKHLISLSENGRRSINRMENPIHTIAARIITSPEAVSRTLKVFKSAGVLRANRTEIEILDPRHLQELAKIDL